MSEQDKKQDAASEGQLSDEQLEGAAGGVDFDQLRRENLDKDAVDFDKLRQENLEKDQLTGCLLLRLPAEDSVANLGARTVNSSLRPDFELL